MLFRSMGFLLLSLFCFGLFITWLFSSALVWNASDFLLKNLTLGPQSHFLTASTYLLCPSIACTHLSNGPSYHTGGWIVLIPEETVTNTFLVLKWSLTLEGTRLFTCDWEMATIARWQSLVLRSFTRGWIEDDSNSVPWAKFTFRRQFDKRITFI